MINKKIILGLFAFSFLGACTAPTAMLGPAYTLTSTGNVVQAGFSYGSSELIKSYTGKTPIENIKSISSSTLKDEQNIQKLTLESQDFHNLIKSKIKKNKEILNKVNQ
tara:strand:- start:579 stop:902 length:324 start_codon:yes stop_codon:yes gene_type:complete